MESIRYARDRPRFHMPPPLTAPQQQTCGTEEKEDELGEAAGHRGGSKKTTRGWDHPGSTVHGLAVERGTSQKSQWQVAHVRRLHRPQQGLPQGPLSSSEHTLLQKRVFTSVEKGFS